MPERPPFDISAFAGWLAAAGAEILAITNPWEILRVRTDRGTLVAYTNAKGRQTWPPKLMVLRRAYEAGEAAPNLTPPATIRGTLVTVFADASFDQQTGAAGWGAWIRRHGRAAMTCSGAITAAVAQSGHAELCALALAITAARDDRFFENADAVLLESDSFHALAFVRSLVPGVTDRPAEKGIHIPILRKPRPTEAERAAIEAITEIAGTASLTLFTRHVRGHTPGGGRQWVNRECDRLARAAMRQRQQDLQGDNNGAF